MKNILNETPEGKLTGRLLASMQFVDKQDVRGKEILDIGCGYGWCELNFLEWGAKKIIGTEVTKEDLATIRKNISDDRVQVQVGSAIALPFPDESFDTIVSWEVIEHIPQKTEPQMFAEIRRVLKPGGVFYLSTPHASFTATLLDPAWWLSGHRHYSRGMLARYAKVNDLSVEKSEVKARWWGVMTILNGYISKWILRRPMLFADYFVRKEDMEYRDTKEGFMNIFVKFRKK